MTKYYYAQNANRLIDGVQFELTGNHGGTATGVFAADTPELIAKLSTLAANAMAAVEEVTQEFYEKKKQGKGYDLRNSNQSSPPLAPPPQPPPVPLKSGGVLAAAEPATPSPEVELESSALAIKVEVVVPPATVPETPVVTPPAPETTSIPAEAPVTPKRGRGRPPNSGA